MSLLFSRYRSFLYLGAGLGFLIFGAMMHDGRKWYFALAAFLVTVVIAWFAVSVLSVLAHRRFLSIFYSAMKPEEFISVYTPLVKKSKVRKNIRFSMECYLSNAYAAAGKYRKALEILDGLPVLGPGRRNCAEAIIAGNRCDIFCAMEKFAPAKAEYEKLKKYVADGEKSQQGVLDILTVKMAVLSGSASQDDIDTVKTALSKNTTPFFRYSMRYLLARIHEITGEINYARTYYEEISKGSEQLIITKKAAERLKILS